MTGSLAFAAPIATAARTLAAPDSRAQDTSPPWIGARTFLSRPVAGPVAVPTGYAADLLSEAFDRGGAAPGDEETGFGGQSRQGSSSAQSVHYGNIRIVNGQPPRTNVKYDCPEQIGPPDGVRRFDWIRRGFKC